MNSSSSLQRERERERERERARRDLSDREKDNVSATKRDIKSLPLTLKTPIIIVLQQSVKGVFLYLAAQ